MSSFPQQVITSKSFQRFLTANDTTGIVWDSVFERVNAECEKRLLKNTEFEKLVMALAKYDFSGAPSNWYQTSNHESYIFDFAEYVLENFDEEEIDKVTKTYELGHIPDCFAMMMSYVA